MILLLTLLVMSIQTTWAQALEKKDLTEVCDFVAGTISFTIPEGNSKCTWKVDEKAITEGIKDEGRTLTLEMSQSVRKVEVAYTAVDLSSQTLSFDVEPKIYGKEYNGVKFYADKYAGGSGKKEDPYIISSDLELAKLARDVTNGNFDYRNNCFKENTSKDNLFYTGVFKAEFLLEKGDIITRLGGSDIATAQDFRDALSALDGSKTTVTFERDGKQRQQNITPVQDAGGAWKLGLWLRDGISGVGTLTFYDPATGVYGALGHSISDSDAELLLPLREGSISDAEIVSIVPGSSGKPGELNGCADTGRTLGSVERNTELGIYGHVFTQIGRVIVETGEMHTGAATIISTVNGREAKEYGAEINRIYNEPEGQRMMLTVTDPELRSMTGGIVQGMSGSPVMQDGKLVGAVTHVFVSDPAKGFGIGIYDMLETAGIREQAA